MNLLPNPQDNSHSLPHRAAKASVLAAGLTIGLLVGLRNNIISNAIAGVLIVAGFIAAIVALAGIRRYGTRDLLGRGLAGLLTNGFLITIFVINFSTARQKAIASRTAWQNLESTDNDIDSNLKKSFDPKNGVTNFDPGVLGKLSDSLKNVSQSSSGDDASIAKALSAYADRTQTASKTYQSARTKLREAHVLNHFDSSDKAQLAARREIVQQFLDANTALKQVAIDSEDRMRADLAADHIPNIKIDGFIKIYHASTEPARITTVKVRECDERVGAAMLDMLSVLETHWGRWKADLAVDNLLFDDADTRTTYNNDLAAIKTAVEEQSKLQSQFLNQPGRGFDEGVPTSRDD